MKTAIISQFQFLQYTVDRVVFARNDGFLAETFEYTITFDSTVLEPVSPQLELASPFTMHKQVQLAFRVAWKPEPGPFILEVVLRGDFACHEEMSAQVYQNFLEIHAPAVLFAHARPLVATLMGEAKEMFTLPLINLAETIRQARAAQEEE